MDTPFKRFWATNATAIAVSAAVLASIILFLIVLNVSKNTFAGVAEELKQAGTDMKQGSEKILTALSYQKSDTTEPQAFGYGDAFERAGYAAIGSPSASTTFTFDWGNNSSTAYIAKGFANVVIAGEYVPQSEDSRLYLALERSLDNGATYQPYSVLSPTTNDTLVYSDTFATTGTQAHPFVIPGDLTSVSGTTIGFSFDLTMAADFLRVSAKEYATGTRGLGYVKVLLNTN